MKPAALSAPPKPRRLGHAGLEKPMRKGLPVYLCDAQVSPSKKVDITTAVYRIGHSIEFADEYGGRVRTGPRPKWEPEYIKEEIATAYRTQAIGLRYHVCSIRVDNPKRGWLPTFVSLVDQCLVFEGGDGEPAHSAPRPTWTPEEVEHEIAAAYGEKAFTLRFPKAPFQPPFMFTIPMQGRRKREELPERNGTPVTRGKDRTALSLIRDRLASVENCGHAPRELEVDIHRWFFEDYIFRKRGEWLAKCWTGFFDCDLDDNENVCSEFAHWHLGLFRIPEYASDTDAALDFSHSCFVQDRLLSIHEVDDENYRRWRAEVTGKSGEMSGSGQHATLALAIMLAVLEAVATHGTAWDAPPNPGDSDG
jgi:hypothetical protein